MGQQEQVGKLSNWRTLKLCLKQAAVTELLLIVYVKKAGPNSPYRELCFLLVTSLAFKNIS